MTQSQKRADSLCKGVWVCVGAWVCVFRGIRQWAWPACWQVNFCDKIFGAHKFGFNALSSHFGLRHVEAA